MSFQKLKIDSYCVGGRHKSVKKNGWRDNLKKDR